MTTASQPTRPLYWSVRRELWEYRTLVIVPVCVAVVVLFGATIGAFNLLGDLPTLAPLDPVSRGNALATKFSTATIPINMVMFIVACSYCLGALHNERRDRSILFWKSLPVSDLTVVLAKAMIVLVVYPLIIGAIIIATQIIMLLITTAVLALHGADPAMLWTDLPWAQLWVILLYDLATMALWYAPVYGWLLLASVWARRAPFLWAVLPPLGLCLAEVITTHTMYIPSFLLFRLTGIFGDPMIDDVPNAVADRISQLTPLHYLANPNLWEGLAITAACLAAAVWLRRYREPI